MSKRNRPRLSLPGDRNDPTTAPTAPPQAEISVPIQEKQMPMDQDQSQEKPPEETEGTPQEQAGPTAKQLAAVEEANAKRIIDQQHAEAQRAEKAAQEPISLVGMAARGREALLDGLRQHAQAALPPPYVPPPMTARQLSVLEEEMAAGARRVAMNEAQKVRSGHPLLPQANDPLSNPVHRPNDVVPDPILTGSGKAGLR